MKRDETPEIWYYHYNNTGSTTEVTDQSGKIVYRISYGTYGELRGITSGDGENVSSSGDLSENIISDLRFLYNGQLGVETEENGLYYMRARYYNPQIKRFISRDPLEGDITDSRTLNHYSYVLGNPVSLTDPFGLCAEEYYSNKGHEALDILGYFFDLADAANTIWYAAEGNYKMAGINLIAVIPIAGSGISKAGKEAAEEATEKAAIKAMREGAEEATEKATKEAAEKYARENAQKYAKKNATQNAAKTADDAAKAAGKGGNSSSWNKGSFDSSQESLEYHFKKHGNEVGAKDIEQYTRKAEEFAKNAKKGSTKSSVRGEVEGVIRYKKNGKYIDIASDGSIVSFGKQ